MRDIALKIDRHIVKSTNIPNKSYLFPLTIKYLHYRNPLSYTDADPTKVLRVDPSTIKIRSVQGSEYRFGEVSDFSTQKNRSNNTYLRIKSILDHFTEGVPWKETEYYKLAKEKLNRKSSAWGISSDSDLHSRFKSINDLYSSISDEGYKTQKQLLAANPKQTVDNVNGTSNPLLNEVGVNIDSDGTIIFRHCGLHRLAIAKTLEIEKIPIQVRVRHRKWQIIRNDIQDVDSIGDLPDTVKPHTNHPDLQDLLHDNVQCSVTD